MARPCTACSHPERNAIDRFLVNGTSLQKVADQFRLTKRSVGRHKSNCIPDKMARGLEKRNEVAQLEAIDLTHEARTFFERLKQQADDAEKNGDGKLFVQVAGAAEKYIRLLGEIEGRLKAAGSINIDLRQNIVFMDTILGALD